MWSILGRLFTSDEACVAVPRWHPDKAHKTAISILRRTKWTRETVTLLLDLIQQGHHDPDLLKTLGTLQDCEDMNNAICSLVLYHLSRKELPQHIVIRSAVHQVVNRVFKSKEKLEE